MTIALLVALLGGIVSVALTGVVRRYALRYALLDHPNSRSSHVAPTPRGGGLAIVSASLFAIMLGAALGLIEWRLVLAFGPGMLVLGATGWLDDARGLRASTRLLIHGAVGAWTIYVLGGLPAIRIGHSSLPLGVAGAVVGILGLVWSINLFNFMDGIDGLAGSQAAIIFAAAAVLLFWTGDASLGALASILAATAAGFLVWNWPPAKIFMGDVGSATLGYLIAGIAIASENRGAVPLLAFAILDGIFIADATITLLRRVARGAPPAEAHRDHAYQRLARVTGGHRRVTVGAAWVALLLALLGGAGTIVPRLLVPSIVLAGVLLAGLLFLTERHAPM